MHKHKSLTPSWHGRPISFGWLAVALLASPALAGLTTDGSVGATVSLSGNMTIPQALGKTAGNNLFHSFSTFNVNSGESATFTMNASVANVISRVTGGSPSTINGMLAVDANGGTPAFYFINPAGVTFGAGASIDVPGSFHVSTADYIKFPDGMFHADLTKASVLSAAAPEAFGFVGPSPRPIVIQNAWLDNPSGAIEIVAGDVTIDAGAVTSGGGNIHVAAVGSTTGEFAIGTMPATASGTLTISGGGIATEADTSAPGGNITIAAGDTRLSAGGMIYTHTLSGQPAGNIALQVGRLDIDGQDSPSSDTGILSRSSGEGAAGNIDIAARGNVSLMGGGVIRSDAMFDGESGKIHVAAQSVTLDGAGSNRWTRITNESGDGLNTHPGGISIEAADSIRLDNGARITANNWGSGEGNPIRLNAGQDILIMNGGTIAADAYGDGNGGAVSLQARNLTIDGSGSRISGVAQAASLGNASTITIRASDTINVLNGAQINTSTYSVGQAGDIRLAAGALLIDGQAQDTQTGIFSETTSLASGNAGTIRIDVAGDALIQRYAQISSRSYGSGNAADIALSARNLRIDTMGRVDPYIGAALPTGIFTEATWQSRGNAGNITIDVPGHLELFDGAVISAVPSVWATGTAGDIRVTAGQLTIDGRNQRGFTGLETASMSFQGGGGGKLAVSVTGDATLSNGGYLRSDTWGSGKGGDIELVTGGHLTMDGGNIESSSSGTGTAGNIHTEVAGQLTISRGGYINSDAYDAGNGGTVTIRTGALTVDGRDSVFPTSISSSAYVGSSGNAGSIALDVSGPLVVRNGGSIESSTMGSGQAGNVSIRAESIGVIGTNEFGSSRIAAKAKTGSSGQTGTVALAARDSILIADGATVSIENQATVDATEAIQPTTLQVSAPRITLQNGSITAAATGNVAASNIVVDFTDRLYLDPSAITTSAQNGNGGSIAIRGGRLIWLDNSQITTSVLGLTGNGGDISIAADALFLNTGFIQANTAAAGASGGRVGLNVPLVLASGSSVAIGGAVQYALQPGRFGYNVIQAAAPDGVSGAISMSAPVLDLSGALAAIGGPLLDSGGLGRNQCLNIGGSSLSSGSWESLPGGALDLLSSDTTAAKTATTAADAAKTRE